MSANSETQIAIVGEVVVQNALFVDDSSSAKRNAAIASTPDREGKLRGEKASRFAVYPTVPFLPAPISALLQSATNSSSSSGGDVSMANIESLFTRLLLNTKTEICNETATLVANHVTAIQSDITSVRRELAEERDARLAQSDVLDARVKALEAKLTLSNQQTQLPQSQSSSLCCVVGGFGLLTREASIAKVQSAVDGIDGFSKVIIDRIGAVPKVIVCEFSSHGSMMVAMRSQK